LLVNIYFGGYMKRKRKKILLCFIFLFFYWLWTHYCKLIMLKWDNWFH
jgi:lipopolysaccharide export LptBFGC system permease protein LptF